MRPIFFLCYRPVDIIAGTAAYKLRGWLVNRFGKDSVFLDSESLAAGVRWKQVIEVNLADCAVVCPIIGPEWERQFKPPGQEDVVRYELELAFEMERAICPILIERHQMPAKSGEPLIEKLNELQWTRIDQTRHFEADMERFARDLLGRQVIRASLLTDKMSQIEGALKLKAFHHASQLIEQLPLVLQDDPNTHFYQALILIGPEQPRKLHRSAVDGVLELLARVVVAIPDTPLAGETMLLAAYLKEGAFRANCLEEPGLKVGELFERGVALTGPEDRRALLALLHDPSNAIYQKLLLTL